MGELTGAAVIEVEQLTKRYGERTAVADLSFQVRRGEVVGFLGPNGAGKSTTLRMITGFLAPTAGRIQVGGHDVLAHPRDAQRQLGYMPEGVPLYPELRVSEYLRHRAALKGVPRRQRRGRLDAAVDMAGLGDARDRLIGQLSKGYRQRVGMADALIADPPVLILDEPTAGLDPNQIRDVRELVRGFAGDKTVLLSTHILPEVEATCGRVLIIHQGRLVEEGDPSTLRSRAAGREMVDLVGRGSPEDYRRAIDALAGVTEVRAAAAGDAVRVEVEGDRGAGADAADDLVERVARAVAGAGLPLRELRTRNVSLEDVFARLTTEADAADAGLSGDPPNEGSGGPPSEAEPPTEARG